MTVRIAHRRRSRVPNAMHSLLLVVVVSLILIFLAKPSPTLSTLRHAPNNLVIVTASNWMYHQFLHNFKCNLDRLQLGHTPLVYSLDMKTHNLSHHLALSSVLVSKEMGDDASPGHFQRVGPRSFNDITKKKLAAVVETLRSGFDVLFSDADVFWCQDAVQYIRDTILPSSRYSDADVLIQPEAKYRTLNSGFYYVKANSNTLLLFEKLMANVNIGAHDQDVVNAVFCEEKYGGARILQQYGDVPFHCESHGAVIRLLPSHSFPSGAEVVDGKNIFEHSRDTLTEMCNRKQYVVLHNNFIRATKKRARFVVKGMWLAGKDNKGEPICQEPLAASDTAIRTCGKYC